MSVTLFEGIILLVIAGAGVVAWWGIRRLVKMSDDASARLTSIDKSLTKICERLGKSDTWMEMHTREDDTRHDEVKRIYGELKSAIEKIKEVKP